MAEGARIVSFTRCVSGGKETWAGDYLWRYDPIGEGLYRSSRRYGSHSDLNHDFVV